MTTTTATATQTWKIDPAHSVIEFKVRHMMISTVSGRFKEFDATIKSTDDKFTNLEATFTAQVDSIFTNQPTRDNHLKSADFFDGENHPEISFRSKSFNGGVLVGDLTMRGVTKEIELEVDFNGTILDPYGQTKAGFELSGEVNRKDFNLNWNAVTEAGGVVVSDKVRLAIDAQFVKEA